MNRIIKYTITKESNRERKLTEEEFKELHYESTTTSITGLVDYLNEGRAFCHSTFYPNRDNSISRRKENWKSSDMVVIDVDNSPVSYTETLESLTFSPTISYPSFSYDEQNQRYKYRLVYVLDETITNKELYQSIYDGLCWQLEWDLCPAKENWHNEDNGGRELNRMFLPTDKTIDYDSSQTYSIDDFWKIIGHHPGKEPARQKKDRSMDITYDEKMKADLFAAGKDLKGFCFKWYGKGYRPIFDTPLQEDEFIDGIALKENSSMYWGHINLWEKRGKRKILGPGDGRRHKMYSFAAVWRKMGLNANQMMFNLANVVAEFMDNVVSKKDRRPKYTGKEIWDIVKDVMSITPDAIDVKEDNRKMRVSTLYRQENNMTHQAVLGQYRKKQTDRHIESNYDILLSDQENAERCGCSATRISQWRCQEQGITKKQMTDAIIEHHYSPELSLRENAAQIYEKTGRKIGKDRIASWLKEQNPKTT